MDIQENVILANFTNFRVGGPADYFIEVKSANELKDALQFAKEKNITVAVLGGGMNVLVSDAGFRGLVIRIAMAGLSVEDDLIIADAGCTMGQVVAAAQKAGLTGLEWAVGLPGTVGGAVFGNAGCFGGETKDVVSSAALLDPRTAQIMMRNAEDLHFGYRHSALKESGDILLAATFHLKKGSTEEIASAMNRIRQKTVERVKEQPLGAWTAGSTFKGVLLTSNSKQQISNICTDWQSGINRAGYLSAGWLIEQAGLKGHRVGGASFSAHHANFIINHGEATAADIMSLIQTAKERVRDKFGIELEEEIRYIE